jgi:hypothetical protein
VHVAEDDAVNDVIQVWLRIALLCALFFLASGDSSIAFLSEPADERPAEEMPRLTPRQGNTNFDGAWIFTSAGCRHTGSLPAMITGGRIIVRGGSGQVDPDGTFNRSDGCVGSWIAIKH